MVVGVVQLARLSRDDAPRAAVPRASRASCPARGRYRVFPIVIAPLARQQLLAVAERLAVLRVRKRPSGPDEGDGLPCFSGEILRADLRLEGENRKNQHR